MIVSSKTRTQIQFFADSLRLSASTGCVVKCGRSFWSTTKRQLEASRADDRRKFTHQTVHFRRRQSAAQTQQDARRSIADTAGYRIRVLEWRDLLATSNGRAVTTDRALAPSTGRQTHYIMATGNTLKDYQIVGLMRITSGKYTLENDLVVRRKRQTVVGLKIRR